ncbi:MAG: methyltransferase, FxLD system [Pseudonocardia sp.]
MGAAERARERLVDALRGSGHVHSPAVEAAFRAVPRHLFLPGLPLRAAYADEAVAVQHIDGVATSSASQPSMMAIMLEQLDLRPGHRVLEVGAGTGYNAALMMHLVGTGGAVTAVDIDAELVSRAAGNLASAGISGVDLHCADGALGHPDGAPYDRIVLTVGSGDVRPEWIAQLAPGGRLLLPLTLRGNQVSVALDLGPDGVLRSDSVHRCGFIRLRGMGAEKEITRLLATEGLTVLISHGAPERIDPAEVRAALADPGPFRPVAVRLRSSDLWDGFGLWLALAESGTCRVLATDPDSERAAELFPLGTGLGTIALAAPAGAPGFAAVALRPGNEITDRTRQVGVRAFGAAGAGLADRVVAELVRWAAAGRPGAGELLLQIVPRTVELTPPGSGATVVAKEHSQVLVRWSNARSNA